MTRIEPYSDKDVKSVLENLLKDEQFLTFIKDNLNSSTSKSISINTLLNSRFDITGDI